MSTIICITSYLPCRWIRDDNPVYTTNGRRILFTSPLDIPQEDVILYYCRADYHPQQHWDPWPIYARFLTNPFDRGSIYSPTYFAMVLLCYGTCVFFVIDTPVPRHKPHNLLQLQETVAAEEAIHAIVSVSSRTNDLTVDDTATEQTNESDEREYFPTKEKA